MGSGEAETALRHGRNRFCRRRHLDDQVVVHGNATDRYVKGCCSVFSHKRNTPIDCNMSAFNSGTDRLPNPATHDACAVAGPALPLLARRSRLASNVSLCAWTPLPVLLGFTRQYADCSSLCSALSSYLPANYKLQGRTRCPKAASTQVVPASGSYIVSDRAYIGLFVSEVSVQTLELFGLAIRGVGLSRLAALQNEQGF